MRHASADDQGAGTIGFQRPMAFSFAKEDSIAVWGISPISTRQVAQTFLSAGWRNFPVPCGSELGTGKSTGKSPEPADKNVCATCAGLNKILAKYRIHGNKWLRD